MAKDPICGMLVDESSPLRTERDGQTFYFCSDHCRQKFLSASASASSATRLVPCWPCEKRSERHYENHLRD
jgi:YHS domain-containing protein